MAGLLNGVRPKVVLPVIVGRDVDQEDSSARTVRSAAMRAAADLREPCTDASRGRSSCLIVVLAGCG
jgi:hypothetical protein